jgi:uncharacterized protein YcgI (DUF1989 family)
MTQSEAGHCIPAGHGYAVRLDADATMRVRQSKGQQVVDMIAFHANDLTEYLSPNHTIVSIGRLWPLVGQRFYSNRRSSLLEVVEDSVGKHDLLVAACDPWRYLNDFGVAHHRSCSDNFLEVLSAFGLQRHQLPQPVNLFQNMAYAEDGSVTFHPSLARADDHMVFKALVPLLVALSACPMDLNPISGGYPSHVFVEVVPPPMTSQDNR